VPGRTNHLTGVNIACYLERPKGLLPLPEGSARLEKLPVYTMQKNSAGAVVVEGPGLVIFDAFYGPGETLDGPPDIKQDISVPDSEVEALDKVIEEFQLSGNNPAEPCKGLTPFSRPTSATPPGRTGPFSAIRAKQP